MEETQTQSTNVACAVILDGKGVVALKTTVRHDQWTICSHQATLSLLLTPHIAITLNKWFHFIYYFVYSPWGCQIQYTLSTWR